MYSQPNIHMAAAGNPIDMLGEGSLERSFKSSSISKPLEDIARKSGRKN